MGAALFTKILLRNAFVESVRSLWKNSNYTAGRNLC